MAKPNKKTHKKGAKEIKKETKKLKQEAKEQTKQEEELLKLPAGGYQAGRHNCFRYGCDIHGSKGEELLTKLPRNANQQRDQRVRGGMLDPGVAGTQPVATAPAEDGEANNVDDDDDAAAHKDEVEAPAYDHAQVHGQAPANAEANAALSTTEQDV
ncbi:hypothetical protein LTR24_003545 [Lithohypha guttulata]|uniref:Uncharacterized protein n=1 Tax=Lithohypha guttulata TaxID=1690604 RepID=A0ABR0KES1_9EURO|nr:hypothetical protein LTR24_003545 [Lithohypha guttulata]